VLANEGIAPEDHRVTEASPIPPPHADDDEDVHWALSTASALWTRGDTGEALKWLRRAAETASDQNRDQRALELFKAAADVTSMLDAHRGGSAGPPPAHGSQAPAASASRAPAGAPPSTAPASSPQASYPPPRTSGAPPPPRTSGAPPPPRAAAAPSPRSAGSTAAATPAPGPTSSPAPARTATAGPGQPGTGPMPGPVAAARAVLRGGARRDGKGAPVDSGAAARSPAASTRKRKSTLDDRFQFPDDEVTQQRDVASLRRKHALQELPSPPDEAAAVSAMAPTAPQPLTSAASGPAPRTAAGAAAAARAGGARTSAAPAPRAAYATTTRTILSPGTPRSTGGQPLGGAATAAAAARMSRQPTRKIDTTPPPVDDLDEKTSVLTGDEAELAFEGSETGESALDDPGTEHDASIADPAGDAAPDATPGASSSGTTDEPLYAPSIRPQPPPTSSARSAGASWPALRVALRRDAGGVRIEALAVDAATPPGAVSAVLVAHDGETADALARLLEPR
jgi:hypothetical protein